MLAEPPAAMSSKEKYPPNDDADNPIYRTNEFRMYCLKVLPCSKRYCHDWTTCPFAHAAEKAKRRDPRVYNYTGVACPEMKKNQTCPRGDQCPYAHNVFEYWLHHSRYRTQLCNDGAGCKRKICFFAHTLDELRVSSVKVQVPDGSRSDSGNGCINPFAPSPRSSRHGNHQAPTPAAAAVAADKQGPLISASSSPASLLTLPELQHLQEGYSSLPEPLGAAAAGSGSLQDQLALEHLMRLVAMTQQQQVAPEVQQLLAAQMLMAQQQQQAAAAAAAAAAMAAQQQQQAAVLQAQQQMAALQLLSHMNHVAPGMAASLQEQYAAAAAAAAMASAQGFNTQGFPGQAAALQHQQQQHAMAAALSGMGQAQGPPAGRPTMMSALTAALSQEPAQPMDELARQLSGLSTSSQVQVPMSPMGHHLAALQDDANPNSARSYGSAYGGPSGGCMPPQRRSSGLSQTHSQRSARGPQEQQLPPTHPMGAGPSGMAGQAAGAGMKMPGGCFGPVGGARSGLGSAPTDAGLRTSPISISALADTYTTTTGNSYFSISHSLTSSHDGSDLEALPQ